MLQEFIKVIQTLFLKVISLQIMTDISVGENLARMYFEKLASFKPVCNNLSFEPYILKFLKGWGQISKKIIKGRGQLIFRTDSGAHEKSGFLIPSQR